MQNFLSSTPLTGHAGCLKLRLLPLLLAAGIHGLPLVAQDAETITRIEVIGANKQTAETVIYKSGLKEGDDLRSVDLTAVIERLWASGSFDDIKLEVEDYADGKLLLIHVTERPIIKDVIYRGGTLVGLSSIQDKIKDSKDNIAPDSVYDPEAARKIKEMIVQKCAEKGYRNPVVDVDLEFMAPGMARLVFDVKEGGKAKIYRIVFKGNKVLSSSKLRKAMKKTRTRGWLSWMSTKSLVVEKNLEEDLENIRKAYWRVGYKDVFVGQPQIEVEDLTSPRQKRRNLERIDEGRSPKYDLRATLTIPLLEGEQFFEGTFRVEGNNKVFKGKQGEDIYRLKIAEARRDHSSRWAKLFGIKPDIADLPPGELRPFDLDAVDEGIEKMREEYGNQAHVMFNANKTLTVREDEGVKKVDVVVKVSEGEPYTVRRIAFEGNTLTKDKVIRRAMLLKEGEPFRTNLLRESFTSIGQLGYFDVRGQQPKVDFIQDKTEVDVTLPGQEAGTNEIRFQGGYGSVFGFSFGASYATKNLGGGGETLSVAINRGQYQKSVSISYTEPFLFDLPYSLSTSLVDSNTTYDESKVGDDNAYNQKTRSIGASLGIRLSNYFPESVWAFYTTYGVGASVRRDQFSGGDNYLYRDIGTLNTTTFSQSLTYDTVDHPFKPTHGDRVSLGFEFAGWGSDRPFHRTSLDLTKYFNFGGRHVIGLNASYGYTNNLSKNGIPYFNYYKLGGEDSIRGYPYGQIGSIVYDNGKPIVVGGIKKFMLNFEYQFRITEDFRAVIFYDAGNAWGPGEKMFNQNLIHYNNPETGVSANYRNPKLLQSVGIEFRLFIPISPAPLRFIWARKQNPYPWDRKSVMDFQFSLGSTF